MNDFIKYLEKNKIAFRELPNCIEILGETYKLVDPIHIKYDAEGELCAVDTLTHFTDKFELIHDSIGYDNTVILFGGRYYYISAEEDGDVKMNELKYVGDISDELPTESYLGIHGGFELLSGSRSYADWCKKAKFMHTESLGLCEFGTMAGMLKFQIECLKNNIKPILGVSYKIQRGDITYVIKLYIKSWTGWINLLDLNYEYNVNGNKIIDESLLLNKIDGLVVVIDPKTLMFDEVFPLDFDNDIYYQLDTVEFDDDDRDYEYLKNLNAYVNSNMKPVSIRDSYYLDQEDNEIKTKLSLMSNNFTYTSKNQHFKTNEDYFIELSTLFKEDDDRVFDIYDEATSNENKIANECNFNIDIEGKHLPPYELTDNEKELYGDKDSMFWSLIQEGLEELYPEYNDTHLSRIAEEMETIEAGGFVDYFLTTRDIVNAASNEGILQGLARGSAGGSIISYLLGIIKIDPLEFKLLFSRFLNKGRIGEVIDCDVISIELEDGTDRKLYPNEDITIYNDGETKVIKCSQLKEGDDIK